MGDAHPSNLGDLSGQKFGQYEIGELLGQGGMATVYRALQTSIGRTVAIKVMPTYFLGDPSFLQRFEREVKVIAELQHPRVLPVYDFGQVESRPFIVMAYMPGGTVADMMKNGPMVLDQVTKLVEQIGEGLDHAHRKGIIHRDFKPSNVLLDENGNAYLADFGIAKVAESTMALTGSGIVGTPAYMAPEMAEHGTISPAVDIYALGITIYQMFTGKFPFEGETPIRVMMAHTQDPIPDVREARPDLPEGIAEVVKTAMAKKPGERYASAGELAAALKAAASGLPFQAVPPSPASVRDRETMVGKTSAMPSPTPAQQPTPAVEAAPHPPEIIPPSAPAPVGRRRPPTWAIIIGAVGVIALAVCLCVTFGPAIFGGGDNSKANLIIDNQSGSEVCQVNLALAGSGSSSAEQLGTNTVPTGTTFKLTGIDPGAYDISAVDCSGALLADDKSINLPTGDFTWTINPPQ